MEKYLVSLLFSFTCISAAAEANKESNTPIESVMYRAACVDAVAFTKLINEFEEIPFARGFSRGIFDDSALSLVVFVNPNTKSFTISERIHDNKYCIISLGNNFEPVPKEIIDNVINERQKNKS